MKLLILTSEFPPGPGGIGTHAFQLAQHLSDVGVTVRVIASQDYASPSEIKYFNENLPFTVIKPEKGPLRFIRGLSRANRLRDEVQHFQPDLVLATGTRSVWITAAVLSIFQKPWCAVGHGTEFGSLYGLNALLTRLAFDRASGIICVSEYTRKQMRKLGITRQKSHVIYNGADDKQFFPLKPNELTKVLQDTRAEGKFILLTVGSLSDRKGQEVVIRALPAILQKVPNVEYWMAGMPFKKVEFEELAKSLGVEKHIRIWGRVDNNQLNDLYNASDLFVMTSRRMQDGDFEGYGIAVMEAGLCGKPAVVSNGSGLEEAVIDGQTGLLVNQDDPAGTAKAILKLAQDDMLRKSMGEKANERTRNSYTWQQVTKIFGTI